MSLSRNIRVILYVVAAGIAGLAIGARAYRGFLPAGVTAAPSTSIVPSSAAGLQVSFAPIVDKDLPAIVNISSSKVIRSSGGGFPFLMDPFFRQFFGDDFGQQFATPRTQVQHGLGSGVIVKPDGYILTNNHVIDGATDIEITLLDKRKFKAKIVGTDSRTDLGVLKIDVKDLPALAFADSSKVRVGDIALAMGQPFGLGQSVTMGIISAKGRTGIGNIQSVQDFIQTDAAINPGNSGGALVDMRGELIGINTAILTHGGGGNEGVGFAIPVNLAKNVMDQVIAHGKVSRGYMGIAPADISPALAKAMHLTDLRGVLVNDVPAGGPAAQAGIERGDVIVEFNGERVENSNQFRLQVSLLAPGTMVPVKLLRDGASKTVSVKLSESPVATARNVAPPANESSNALDGVQVEDLNPGYLRQLGLPNSTRGVVVTAVADASPASAAGLQSGDVIQEIDRERVSSVADFDRALRRARGRTVLLLVNRSGATRYLAIEPE
ncbi:MAG TPA: DegQ family serine endoprotease [Bryobacteraceae bacterium]|nr:DegQ family serine endoprotease [Bryobacteraceae bacterium]